MQQEVKEKMSAIFTQILELNNKGKYHGFINIHGHVDFISIYITPIRNYLLKLESVELYYRGNFVPPSIMLQLNQFEEKLQKLINE